LSIAIAGPLGYAADSVNAFKAVCAVPVADGRTLLASASYDRTVRLWDPTTGTAEHTLKGHTSAVNAVCAVPAADGRTLLASAGADRTVRLWDPATGSCELIIPVHHPAQTLTYAEGQLIAGLAGGLLALHIASADNPR
jgi:WD40 repeat protein